MPDPVKLRLVDLDETIKDNSEKGRLAAAVREGRRRADAKHAAEAAKRQAEHAGQIDGLKQAQLEELSRIAARERAIGHHRAAWLYGIPALIVGGIAATVGMVYMQDYTADTLARNFREQAMTGAIIQANQEPQRCVPGETLSDGRVCPQRP